MTAEQVFKPLTAISWFIGLAVSFVLVGYFCCVYSFLLLLVFSSGFRLISGHVSVIVIAFLSSEHYFITGFYSYCYSYGLLLKLNDEMMMTMSAP